MGFRQCSQGHPTRGEALGNLLLALLSLKSQPHDLVEVQQVAQCRHWSALQVQIRSGRNSEWTRPYVATSILPGCSCGTRPWPVLDKAKVF